MVESIATAAHPTASSPPSTLRSGHRSRVYPRSALSMRRSAKSRPAWPPSSKGEGRARFRGPWVRDAPAFAALRCGLPHHEVFEWREINGQPQTRLHPRRRPCRMVAPCSQPAARRAHEGDQAGDVLRRAEARSPPGYRPAMAISRHGRFRSLAGAPPCSALMRPPQPLGLHIASGGMVLTCTAVALCRGRPAALLKAAAGRVHRSPDG